MDATMKHKFKDFPNTIFIETGSYVGDGIQAALDSGNYELVISIELSPYYYNICAKRFNNNPKVNLYLGNSVDILPKILSEVIVPCTFWLDAHYSGGKTAKAKQDVQILEELEIIKSHYLKTHTILIDDMRAVGTGGKNTDWGRFSKKQVEDLIHEINPAYNITYAFGIVENDILIAQAHSIETSWIKKIHYINKRVYSQSNQDGVLQCIFDNIGTTNKFCIEFGFNSNTLAGGSGANVARLVLEDDWKCLLLDRDMKNPAINLHKEMLTASNLCEVFAKYEVPESPDYVSIDVDSIDLWLMKAMLQGGYTPRVISVEYNSNFPINMAVTTKEGISWGNDMVYGASLSALVMVAAEFGYSLIAVVSQLDLFFVRNDLFSLEIPTIEYFSALTGLPLHPPATRERLKCLVEYPSGNPVTDEIINKNPTIFRIK